MPHPERRPEGPDPERRELARYARAARFAGEEVAGEAYLLAQETITAARDYLDLSAYRFQFDRVDHVAVLGEPPPADIDAQLTAILNTGEPALLPEGVLGTLNRRRLRQIRRASWIEEHHRPGKRWTK